MQIFSFSILLEDLLPDIKEQNEDDVIGSLGQLSYHSGDNLILWELNLFRNTENPCLEQGWQMLRWCRRKCCLWGILGGSASCYRPAQHRAGFGESHLNLNLKDSGEPTPLFVSHCYLFYVIPGISVATIQHMKGGCAAKRRVDTSRSLMRLQQPSLKPSTPRNNCYVRKQPSHCTGYYGKGIALRAAQIIRNRNLW